MQESYVWTLDFYQVVCPSELRKWNSPVIFSMPHVGRDQPYQQGKSTYGKKRDPRGTAWEEKEGQEQQKPACISAMIHS